MDSISHRKATSAGRRPMGCGNAIGEADERVDWSMWDV